MFKLLVCCPFGSDRKVFKGFIPSIFKMKQTKQTSLKGDRKVFKGQLPINYMNKTNNTPIKKGGLKE